MSKIKKKNYKQSKYYFIIWVSFESMIQDLNVYFINKKISTTLFLEFIGLTIGS
jgi:hypothetical protein